MRDGRARAAQVLPSGKGAVEANDVTTGIVTLASIELGHLMCQTFIYGLIGLQG